jgi:hypothetical protein
MQYLHHSASLNNLLGLKMSVGFPWLHHTPSLADVTMETEACTSEVDLIPAPLSLAQQLIRTGKHCFVERERVTLVSAVTSLTVFS